MSQSLSHLHEPLFEAVVVDDAGAASTLAGLDERAAALGDLCVVADPALEQRLLTAAHAAPLCIIYHKQRDALDRDIHQDRQAYTTQDRHKIRAETPRLARILTSHSELHPLTWNMTH